MTIFPVSASTGEATMGQPDARIFQLQRRVVIFERAMSEMNDSKVSDHYCNLAFKSWEAIDTTPAQGLISIAIKDAISSHSNSPLKMP